MLLLKHKRVYRLCLMRQGQKPQSKAFSAVENCTGNIGDCAQHMRSRQQLSVVKAESVHRQCTRTVSKVCEAMHFQQALWYVVRKPPTRLTPPSTPSLPLEPCPSDTFLLTFFRSKKVFDKRQVQQVLMLPMKTLAEGEAPPGLETLLEEVLLSLLWRVETRQQRQ